MSVNVFSVPIFFVLFRETLEAAVIVSVLLAFLYQVFSDNPDMQRKLRLQVWLGTIFGLLISIAIGAAFIAIWYTVANNLWKSTELLWEGSFCLIATVFVTIMAIAMLKTNKVQDKWKFKLSKAMEARMSEKKNEQDNDDVMNGKTGFLSKWKQGKNRIKGEYAFFFLPFITVLREGLEAMVFMGGVAIGESGTAIPLAAICGILCAIIVGYVIYRTGNVMNLHYFFVASTCLLLLVAAGLFSRGIGLFETDAWGKIIGGDPADQASTISYNVKTFVWYVSSHLHFNCCNPEGGGDGGWSIFNAIFGWNNTATIGTIVGYVGYWVVVSLWLVGSKFRELKKARNANEVAGMEAGVWSTNTIGETNTKRAE
ncbi:hypothetical protein BC938DRAFT_481912 [Jimgerdemannia flammicorona]|uniref:Iron permease FTR1/Fip1/EfeU n=1 Tax=Jimgerdemannia flammicorona TaxID=994334 RepID=A0A433QF14_9FUNG|nr:hypothetical protein BC938DRAFT_481912 [Jimgerdemannia flammicorona]